MNKNKFDICIIGAGVIGLSIAYKLSQKYRNIIVVEKEPSFGRHISSRNSEVVHSGFYYPQNSLKALLCVEGNKLLYEFAEKYKIQYKKCGKLIVAHSKEDVLKLEKIRNNSIENNVQCKILSSEKSKKIEPRVKAMQSLWVPSTGIIDTHSLMSKLEFLCINNNVSFLYNAKINNINFESSEYALSLSDNDEICSDIVVNCGGLWAHNISSMLNLKKYDIDYYKGDYYKSSKIRDLNCLIYPIPSISSLGIHTVLSLNGEVSFGPNIYKVNQVDYSINSKYHDDYYIEISKFLDIERNDIYPDFSGIRPKIKFSNNFNDFIIQNESESGYENFINLIGIDSPGVTSCLAIANYVNDILI